MIAAANQSVMNENGFKSCCPTEDFWISSILKGDSVASPRSESEWKAVFERASSQNLAPLLFSRFAGHPPGTIPPAVLNEFKMRYLACLARSERVRHEVIEVVDILRDEGIEAVAIKGAALWAEVYDDIGARPVVDADLLVRHKDTQKIHGLVIGQGYKRISTAQEIEILSSVNYIKGRDAVLDFRWDMTHNDHLRFIDHLSADDIFERSIPSSIDGVEINIPCPEDQLLIAAFHASVVHHFIDHRWQYDLVAIIGRYAGELNWTRVADFARRYHLRTALYYSLYRADCQFNARLPMTMIEALKPSNARIRLLNLFAGRNWIFALEILLLESPSDVVRYLFGILFPSRGWLMFHYETERFMLRYRILHPLIIPLKAMGRMALALLTSTLQRNYS